MRPVMILFAKAPIPGRVKTRLLPALTAAQAAALYEAFVRDTLELLQSFAAIADVELHTDIDTDAWRNIAVSRPLQHEGNLGLKMFKALERALQNGHPQAWILGSDSPTLPATHLNELLHTGGDVVLGPTEDGGYYAIGAQRVHPCMFQNVRWSTKHAFEDTVHAARVSGLIPVSGPVWFDIDEPADLERLRRSNNLRCHTSAALRQLTESRPMCLPDDGSKRA